MIAIIYVLLDLNYHNRARSHYLYDQRNKLCVSMMLPPELYKPQILISWHFSILLLVAGRLIQPETELYLFSSSHTGL